jgi:hypothetical protein
LVAIAASNMKAMIATPRPIDVSRRVQVTDDRLVPMLLQRGRNTEDEQGDRRSEVGGCDLERADPGNPHHRRRRVADDAAGTAGIRCRDDRRQVADVNPPPEDARRNRPADQRRRDVVEKTRQQPDDQQQDERAQPVRRQQPRQHLRHATVLEVPRQECEADQQAQQIGQQHPFMGHVRGEAGQPVARLETGDHHLVDTDHRQPAEGHLEDVMVKDRHPEQRRGEE